MSLPYYTKKELESLGADGYKILPVKDEEEAKEVREVLITNKRRARVGAYKKGDKVIPFVVTKERV